MTLTVGICDDCLEQIELIEGYLHCFADWSGLSVIASTDPEDFLTKFKKNSPDLVFLDIDMDGMNGIKLGEKIREIHTMTIIIYITAYEEYALEAFRIRAFHYLLKPLTEAKFNQVYQEAAELLKKRNDEKSHKKYYTIRRKGEIITLDCIDIIYFEKTGHKIKLHTVNSNLDYYGNFVKLRDEIDPAFFIQCHQGYIVNVEKIRAFRDKTLFLEGNSTVPVGRTFSTYIKEIMAKRLFTGVGVL